MSETSVDILCPDLSNNALGRALVLAEIVAGVTDVRVLGVQSKPDIWAGAARARISIVSLGDLRSGGGAAGKRRLRRELAGRKLIVSKACWTSLGLAMRAGLTREQLWLDLDDFELSFVLDRAGRKPSLWLSPPYWSALAQVYACERWAKARPATTVANAWLAERYGGEVLYHLRRETELDPTKVDARAARHAHALDDRLWVGFVGTVRAHKGIEDLAQAVAAISADDLGASRAPGLFIAGADASEPVAADILRGIRARLPDERVRVVEPFASSELARVLSGPDVVVIPTRDTRSAVGQTPAKVFDALFMGKPTVCSALGDVPELVEGAGLTFRPGDVEDLRAQLLRVLRDAALRARLGERARERALAKFTVESARERAARLLEPLPAL